MLKITQTSTEENRPQWLFTISAETSPVVCFSFETAMNIAQFKQRLLTGLDATLNINCVGDKSYISIRGEFCEFYIYTTSASMSCRIELVDCIAELLRFVVFY